MLRSSFDYGRKRRTKCKFSARVKGLPLLRSSGSPLVAQRAKHTDHSAASMAISVQISS